MNNQISHERLLALLNYCPDTGIFTNKVNRGKALAGKVAGSVYKNGYVYICLDRIDYLANRLAWFYTHKVWPVNFIDHKDGNPQNNRIKNLREATHAENQTNRRKAASSNKTGYLGVSFAKNMGRYVARMQFEGKYRVIGYFDTPEDASKAYLEAKRKHHKYCTI